MLSAVDCVLMSNILIHLKDRAKTAPLHSALPANPRHWLGADSKAAHVGLCTTRSQVTSSNIHGEKPTSATNATNATHSVHAQALLQFSVTFAVVLLANYHLTSLLLCVFSSIWTVDQTADWACCLILHAHLLLASFFKLAALQSSANLFKKKKSIS